MTSVHEPGMNKITNPNLFNSKFHKEFTFFNDLVTEIYNIYIY